VLAPLFSDSNVFGILVAARRQVQGFSSGDCEFLRQLSGHVSLAAHQGADVTRLAAAYDGLASNATDGHTAERLRALGQMASGIAHDINNALSPVALYTESLLESEPGLSSRTRNTSKPLSAPLNDVAQTVSRMKSFAARANSNWR